MTTLCGSLPPDYRGEQRRLGRHVVGPLCLERMADEE